MSQVSVRAALETQLATVTFTGGETAYENIEYSPTRGTPHQRVYCMFAAPDNPTMGTGHHRLRGIFQVNLFYPIGTGPGTAAAQAELIKAAFRRGGSYTSGTVTVRIDMDPEIGSANTEDDWYMIPIKVPWFADINS